MRLKKEELKNPVKIKTFAYCNYIYKNLDKKSDYNRAIRLIKYLSNEKEEGGLGYNIAKEVDTNNSDKWIIFCEKEQKKEVSVAVKEWMNG